jgi:flagellar basal-body rod protein FlgG
MMIRSLWTGATGMNAMQEFIDSVGHDLANVNTDGYKKRHLNFQDLFYQRVRASGIQGAEDGMNVPVGVEIGNGVRLIGTTPVFTMGNPRETGVPTNVMITDNSSFFSVTLPNGGGTAYTRDGNFVVDPNGDVVTTAGYQLNPAIGGVPTGARDLTFTADGNLQYLDENGAAQVLGQLNLYNFVNPAGLRAEGGNLWFETDASGAANQGIPGDRANGFGAVQGGWLEGSNVDAVTEMVNMISAQRAYEFNSRTIQTADSMLQTVGSLKR